MCIPICPVDAITSQNYCFRSSGSPDKGVTQTSHLTQPHKIEPTAFRSYDKRRHDLQVPWLNYHQETHTESC
jgi:formate hydrogenlyase subunit 6/NADH:ubiquinone oxidoreductase subunit I